MVCGTCRKQVKNSQCPTCPATFVSRRNTFIEHLLDSIELMNCKYKNLGCPRTLIIKDKDFHENACEYRLVDCPLSPSCKEKIVKKRLLNHLETFHIKKGIFGRTNDSFSNLLLIALVLLCFLSFIINLFFFLYYVN